MRGFWLVEFSNGRLRASHECSVSFVFGLVLSACHTEVASKNVHPPLATSPRPVGSSASYADSSAGQKTAKRCLREVKCGPTERLLSPSVNRTRLLTAFESVKIMASFTLEVMSKLHKGDARRLCLFFLERISRLTHLTSVFFNRSSTLGEPVPRP